MGYENAFKLKILGELTETVPFCSNCNLEKQGKFCSECGSPLSLVDVPRDTKEIIKELRKSNQDCNYLLTDKGYHNESGSGFKIDNEIRIFSMKYPSLIFQLDCMWDSGFDTPPSTYYFKNGVKQNAKVRMIPDEPNFD